MHYVLLIGGWILALAWFSRIVEAALGVPGIADISRPAVGSPACRSSARQHHRARPQ